MARAKKGGEFGANGEWYEGGRFLNTIPENRKREGSQPKKARKVQVAPYTWEPARENERPIMVAFGGFEKCLVENRLELLADQTIRYFGLNIEALQGLADRFAAGERWVTPEEIDATRN